jgi:hypothetical protein
MYESRHIYVSYIDNREYPAFSSITDFIPTFDDFILVGGWAVVLTFLRVIVQKWYKGVSTVFHTKI